MIDGDQFFLGQSSGNGHGGRMDGKRSSRQWSRTAKDKNLLCEGGVRHATVNYLRTIKMNPEEKAKILQGFQNATHDMFFVVSMAHSINLGVETSSSRRLENKRLGTIGVRNISLQVLVDSFNQFESNWFAF